MRKPITILAMSFGGLAALGSVGFAALLAVTGGQDAGRSPQTALQTGRLIGSVLLLGVGFGWALVWAGWRAFRDAPAQPLRLTAWGWLALALGIVLVAGQLLFSARFASARFALFLPFVHVAAAFLPALLFVSLAAWAAAQRGAWVGRRAMLAGLAWGGLGASLLAAVLETLLALVLLVLAFLWFQASDPALLTRLAEFARSAQRGGQVPDLTALMPLLRSPVVVLGILVMLGLGAPLIEEASKALAVPLVALSGHRISRLDGFMFGLAAGAGFAVFEGTLYGALGLSSGGDWASVMLLRAGTTAIHCFAAGLGGKPFWPSAVGCAAWASAPWRWQSMARGTYWPLVRAWFR
jgi:RsiW-degrading membrane proteinase PrsW (M82 family)